MTTLSAQQRPETSTKQAVVGILGALDRALLSLRTLPAIVDRGPIAEPIVGCSKTLLRLAETDVDHPDHIALMDEAMSLAMKATEMLRSVGEVDSISRVMKSLENITATLKACKTETLDALVAWQNRVLRAPTTPELPGLHRPFRASIGLPQLQVLPRRSLDPLVDLSPTEPEDPIDDAEDEPEEVDHVLRSSSSVVDNSGVYHLSDGEIDHLTATARDCLSDIATLGNLRRPLQDQPWTCALRFEQRLLDNLDALLSLGFVRSEPVSGWDLLDEVKRYTGQSVVPDAGRMFAYAFVLGSVEGSDTIRAVMLALRQAHPSTYWGFKDALCLAPNPSLTKALIHLLSDCDASLARLALEVLFVREEVPYGILVPLLRHPDGQVAAQAARCLSAYSHPSKALLLEEMLKDDEEDQVAYACAEGLVRMGHPAGIDFVRRKLEEDNLCPLLSDDAHYAYLRLLVLHGDLRDAELIVNAARKTPQVARILGFYGYPVIVDVLLALLEAGNEVRRATGPWPHEYELAVAGALYRMTGADLHDQAKEETAQEGSGDLAIEAATWVQWWESARQNFLPDRRYRFGRVLSVTEVVEELEDESLPGDRGDCELELGIMTKGAIKLHVTDWVARQRSVLTELSTSLHKNLGK